MSHSLCRGAIRWISHAACTDEATCRALYAGPGCNPPASFSSFQAGNSLSFDDVLSLTGAPVSAVVPVIACLSGFSASTDRCLTFAAFGADQAAGDPCGIAGGGGHASVCGDAICDGTETTCTCSSDCGGIVQVVARSLGAFQNDPMRNLQCDESACYFPRALPGGPTGELDRVSLTDGHIEPFVTTDVPGGGSFAVTPSSVCWTRATGSGIDCASKTDSTVTTVAATAAVDYNAGLVSDGTNLYFASNGPLYSVPIVGGGVAPSLVASSVTSATNLVAAGSKLFFMQGSPADRISAVSTSGGSVTDLVTGPIAQFTTDGTVLCWTLAAPHTWDATGIYCQPVAGGAIEEFFGSSFTPYELTMLGSTVYSGLANGGKPVLVRASLSTGSVSVLAIISQTSVLTRIQLVGDYAYFSDGTSLFRVRNAPPVTSPPIISVTAPPSPPPLLPGQSTSMAFALGLPASAAATAVTFSVTDPALHSDSLSPLLSPGASLSVNLSGAAPELSARAPGETDDAYLARLQALDNSSFSFAWELDWNDGYCDTYGPVTGTIHGTEVLPVVQPTITVPASANAGDTLAYALTLQNTGHGDAASVIVDATLPDGTVESTLLPPLASGATTMVTFGYTIPRDASLQTMTATARVTWSDGLRNTFGTIRREGGTSVIPCVGPECDATPCHSDLECGAGTVCYNFLCTRRLPCTSEAECLPGWGCFIGVCQPPPPDCPMGCGPNRLCCNHFCIPSNDFNCGACGVKCGADQVCGAGGCHKLCTQEGDACQWGANCCNNSCTELSSDSNNCGSCGIVCPLQEFCVEGVCVDALREYARRCEEVILDDHNKPLKIPEFDCENGTEVPQNAEPIANIYSEQGTKCDYPNRLNAECDPGSKFQVLFKDQRSFAVAHCRKKLWDASGIGHRRAVGDGHFGDIAIIEYNTKNGAACFYQRGPAPDLFPGKDPAQGQAACAHEGLDCNLGTHSHCHGGICILPEPAPSGLHANLSWNQPTDMNECLQCHNNGPLVRSPYLAQLNANDLPQIHHNQTGLNPLTGILDALPGQTAFTASDHLGNKPGDPYWTPGPGFQDFVVHEARYADHNGQPGNICATCHRLGFLEVNSRALHSGTAIVFAPESVTMPPQAGLENVQNASQQNMNTGLWWPVRWMMPPVDNGPASTATVDAANAIRDCATSFGTNNVPAGCEWPVSTTPPSVQMLAAKVCGLVNGSYTANLTLVFKNMNSPIRPCTFTIDGNSYHCESSAKDLSRTSDGDLSRMFSVVVPANGPAHQVTVKVEATDANHHQVIPIVSVAETDACP